MSLGLMILGGLLLIFSKIPIKLDSDIRFQKNEKIRARIDGWLLIACSLLIKYFLGW